MVLYGMNAIQITAIAVTIVALLVIVGLFVYNHAAGLQVKTLKSIDKKLDGKVVIAVEQECSEGTVPAEATMSASDMKTEPQTEPKQEEYEEISDMLYNVGKSGKVYIKEELEMQIKD